jgi:peptidoglycan/xylan/chitin deacetylase (PgdA/CDA1 family)
VEGNESILAKMVAEKNELGNHLTEDKPSIKLSPQEFEARLLEAHAVISKFTEPLWMRPASGFYNNTMLETSRKHGYRVALGSPFPFDTHIHSSRFAAWYILFNVRPGSIIVLHDCGSIGQRTARTLERILPVLDRRGYSVVTLSELFQSQNIKLDKGLEPD